MTETDEQFVERMADIFPGLDRLIILARRGAAVHMAEDVQFAPIAQLEVAQASLIEARDQMEACWKREHVEAERLKAALRPFACKCPVKGMGAGGNCTRGTGECDCWNARAALGEERT